MYNGIINVYKEAGFTSHDVVAKLRGILRQKKIGHTGTLDPEAVGVLPVCLGKGTKLCELLTDKDKVYEAVVQLGVVTDTQDMTGKVLREQEVEVDYTEILSCAKSFIGQYEQIPPMYSALKVNGKKLYELAREGIVIERKPRNVEIYSLDLIEYRENEKQFVMRVSCSKGTYIRTLCEDIGEKLGCGACMAELIRTQVSQFKIEDSLTLDQIKELVEKEELNQRILPVEKMFDKNQKVLVKKEHEKRVYNGNQLQITQVNGAEQFENMEIVNVYDSSSTFVGLYQYSSMEKILKPYKMFL